MRINEIIESEIDQFVAAQLASAPEGKRGMLEFILVRTRDHLIKTIGELDDDAFSVTDLDDLCRRLDETAATFAPAVLNSVGAENLEADIIAHRRSVKWSILADELRNTILDDGNPFNPGTIRRLNKQLFNAIRTALRREIADGDEFDWELLRERLPSDLSARYESGIISDDERRRIVDEGAKNQIEGLGLSDIVAGLGNDPKKLAYFLDIAGLDISERDRDRIVYVSFSGLRQSSREPKLDRLISSCVSVLDEVEMISEVPTETEEGHITLTVSVPEGAKYILVRGPWNRDIKVNGSDEVSFDVILKPGEENEIVILAYDEEEEMRSEVATLTVEQTGEAIDEDALVEFLKAISEETLEGIAADEQKASLFRRCIEESVIKRFASNFAEGEAYVRKMVADQNNPFVISIFKEVLEFFREIHAMEFPFIREGEALMFFQKYCVYKIAESRKNGGSVILANEPGLGKTVTALAATHEDEILAICPNSAASTWVEQEARFFEDPFLASLAGYPGRRRLAILERTDRRGVLTNVEFVRAKSGEAPEEAAKTDAKFALLNRRRHPECERVSVIDEAHFLKNDSQQTEGISRLEDDFTLLLTASPFRNPVSLCKVMHRIYPDDPRFRSISAFRKAFPANDPRALKALYVMVQPHVIRFLKSEVMPTSDRSRPAEEQPYALPEKMHIIPSELGCYTLTLDQQMAILEMFEDWDAWTEKYEHYMPRDREAREDGIRSSDNRLTKEHALRQIMNDPRYIGSDKLSPKHQMAKRILEEELAGGNKVVVFCRYHEQIRAYARMLSEMGIEYAEFTGEITRQRYKKDGDGAKIRYQVDEFDNFILDDQGRPVEAIGRQKGKNMLAIDYERLVFQNDPNVQVCLSTYSAGSQSVTFTAASAMIKDDLPEDCVRDYQAEDRIHRIDVDRPKHEVRYYNLIAQYDEDFLDEVRDHMVERELADGQIQDVSAYDLWFSQGTLDEVHFANLDSQKTGFELLNNGISVDPDLVEGESPFAME